MPGPVPVADSDPDYDPWLDQLARQCAAGSFGARDELFYESDEFSGYEAYGSTCGGRTEYEYVGTCAGAFD